MTVMGCTGGPRSTPVPEPAGVGLATSLDVGMGRSPFTRDGGLFAGGLRTQAVRVDEHGTITLTPKHDPRRNAPRVQVSRALAAITGAPATVTTTGIGGAGAKVGKARLADD